MEDRQVRILLMAQPGTLRDSLRALLSTLNGVQTMQTDDVQSAQVAIRAFHPALLIVDLEPSNGRLMEYMGLLRAECAHMKCVVLAEGVQQEELALAAGADTVLLYGFPASRLAATIAQLVNGNPQAPARPTPAGAFT